MSNHKRISGSDLALIGVAILIGLVSLTFPFGNDQALYYYVGREWLKHGMVPYRDLYEHKTPGLYLIHALSIALFGEGLHAIRIAEIFALLGLGFVSAKLMESPENKRPPGLFGAACVIASVLYFGFFNYWDTGQSEIWYSTLGIATVTVAYRASATPRWTAFSGALSAIAMIAKPPAIWFVFTAMVLVGWAWSATEPGAKLRAAFKGLVWFGVGAAMPVAVTALYFIAVGAGGAFVDIVVKSNAHYVEHAATVHSARDVLESLWDFYWYFRPISLVAPVLLLLMIWRSPTREHRRLLGLVLVLLVDGLLALAMQKKFYALHWVALLGPCTALITMLFSWAHREWTAFVSNKRSPALWVLPPLAGLALMYAATGVPKDQYFGQVKNSIDLLRGRITEHQYAEHYTMPGMYFFYGDIEETSRWIKEHTTSEDNILARGFNPEIYALSGRRYQGRFFWTPFLADPQRLYRRTDYLAEDLAAIQTTKPKYVVTLTDFASGVDSTSWFQELGYSVEKVVGKLTIMRHPSVASVTSPP